MKFRAANRAHDLAIDDAGNPSWSHPQVLAILAIVFLLGTAVGVAGTHAYLHSRMMHRPVALKMQLNELKSQLNLSSEQAAIVTKELDDYAKYYENIEEERTDVAQHGKKRILAVLTPRQQKRFIELFDRLPR